MTQVRQTPTPQHICSSIDSSAGRPNGIYTLGPLIHNRQTLELLQERGIARLDGMLGGKGYYRGSSILISGVAGTGTPSRFTQSKNSCF
jgi:4-hydroxy-3-methylbut-2-enyl diphosphate reductase IspH